MIRPALIAGLLLLVGACSSSYDNEDHADMNPLPLKPLCIGSLTLDVPEGKMDWQQTFDYSEVSKLPSAVSDRRAFWSYVHKRKKALEQPIEDNPQGRLAYYHEADSRAATIQFRDKTIPEKGLHTERYLWLDNGGFLLKTSGLFKDEAKSLLPKLNKVFDQIKPKDTDKDTAKKGFCIESAVVTGKIGPISAGMAVDIMAWPGVIFSVDAVEDDGSRDPLPWQLPENKVDQSTLFQDLELRQGYDQPDQSSFEVIRRREKEIAGMPGQEIAYKAVYDNGQIYYNFQWLSLDDDTLPRSRGLGVNLSAGSDRMKMDYDYQAPPDQEDLIALWDDVLDSIQVRAGMK